jgi:gamma-glutamyltranspeptidase / glutathione hydrolase
MPSVTTERAPVEPIAEKRLSFELPYSSRRMPLLARQAVASSHALASQAGLRVLEAGGNAIDAAIATAATLTVVEPTMNGVGSDLFAIVWDGTKLHGLNASGASPRAFSLARFAGHKVMPELGWDAVTVPGAVGGWAALSRRFGARPFASLLQSAIDYARHGFPVWPQTAQLWAAAPARYAGFREFARVFLRDGRAPRAGEWFTLRDLAETLLQLSAAPESLYRGPLAQRMAAAAHADGGVLSTDDLASFEPTWVEPLGIDVYGARLYELPPNGQGLAALIALGILAQLPLHRYAPEDPDAIHLQLEAMKLAFADCQRHVAAPERMRVRPETLLAAERLAALAETIALRHAAPPTAAPQHDHGTVYVTTADRDGRMVSLIQSNYLGFGSGVVVPGTGISLQNRARGFSLDPSSPNCVAGGVRPYHTIMPGFALRDGAPLLSFGVMGGHMQPQGHVQLIQHMLLRGMNPQAACDAPRWYVGEHAEVALEPAFPEATRSALAARGHRLITSASPVLFGGAQAIYRLPDGYCAGCDPRKDGLAVGS